MLTVPEAARRTGRHPETIRRWIRSGKLQARKVGTQHVIEDSDLEEVMASDALPVPPRWRHFDSGRPQPDWAAAIAASHLNARLRRGAERFGIVVAPHEL